MPEWPDQRDLRIMRQIDELHLEHPFYGARRLAKQLEREGFDVGRVHVTTLMHRMGVEALYCRPRTSIPPRDAKIYRYLLDGLAIERHNRRRILQSHEYQYQTSDEIYYATDTAKPSAIAA